MYQQTPLELNIWFQSCEKWFNSQKIVKPNNLDLRFIWQYLKTNICDIHLSPLDHVKCLFQNIMVKMCAANLVVTIHVLMTHIIT